MVKDKPIKFSGLASCSYTYIIININNKYEYIYTYLLKISVEHVLMFIKIGYCWTLCFMLDILQTSRNTLARNIPVRNIPSRNIPDKSTHTC